MAKEKYNYFEEFLKNAEYSLNISKMLYDMVTCGLAVRQRPKPRGCT